MLKTFFMVRKYSGSNILAKIDRFWDFVKVVFKWLMKSNFPQSQRNPSMLESASDWCRVSTSHPSLLYMYCFLRIFTVVTIYNALNIYNLQCLQFYSTLTIFSLWTIFTNVESSKSLAVINWLALCYYRNTPNEERHSRALISACFLLNLTSSNLCAYVKKFTSR